MLILAIDTSGKQGSIALARGDAQSCNVLEEVALAGGTYSAQLIPQLAALLARHGLDKRAIDAFAVASGPGSFTGLRVGLSAAKGLAEVLHKPIAAVSMLEAIAATAHRDGKIIAALDAGRKEIFVGEFERKGQLNMLCEILVTQAEFTELTDRALATQVITPDESVAAVARGLEIKQINWPGSGAVARIGVAKILRGESTAPDVLEANYIRRSDAEIFSKPKG
jgi:tRNA threonylcarbamoyladenosine biosynthesis protein TsaB